jgi:hypothetical protein
MTTDTIPKSLHTVTVLARVAKFMRDFEPSDECAMSAALALLGYHGAKDTHGLAAAASKALGK